MIPRLIQQRITSLAKQFPVIILTGPRQSGKTTLIRAMYQNKPYINLERPDSRERMLDDPAGFLRKYKKEGLIIDEAQYFPDLPSWIQVFVDEDPRPGLFFLTGSNQPLIRSNISQSLAGRAAYIKLLPFCIEEFKQSGREEWKEPSDSFLWKGFYPPIYDRLFQPEEWYSQYVQTYLERDVPHILPIREMRSFQRFLRLAAGRTGQILNMSELARDADVSHTTIKEWLSVLEASFLIFFLQPWHENFSKRLVKSPKMYFYDVGLAGYLAGIMSREQWETHPLRGPFFETLVISDIVKGSLALKKRIQWYYWSAQGGPEVDLICSLGNSRYAFEIKSSATFRPEHTKSLLSWSTLANRGNKNLYLLYDGTETFQHRDVNIVPWKEFYPEDLIS